MIVLECHGKAQYVGRRGSLFFDDSNAMKKGKRKYFSVISHSLAQQSFSVFCMLGILLSVCTVINKNELIGQLFFFIIILIIFT